MSEPKIRALRRAEKDLAWSVFWDTLDFDRVFIGDDLGWEDTAWMDAEDMPGIGTGDYYILHLGKVGYLDATSDASLYGAGYTRMVKTVFIHELTHVWQERRGMWVMARSVCSKGAALAAGGEMGDAYLYESGLEWNEYNVEQQAKIVEDWFMGGMSKDIVLYEYIRDHIRNC
jgi:hypothetical protein